MLKTEGGSGFKNNFLSFDFITFDIFSWLPVKALLRFRCLSTRYRTVIDDPVFAKRQVTRYSSVYGESDLLLLASPDHSVSNEHNPRFPKEIDIYVLVNNGMSVLQTSVEPLVNLVGRPITIRSCCNGLLCSETRTPGPNSRAIVFLFNPFKQECLVLPPPYDLTYDLSYDSSKPREFYGLGYDSSTDAYMVVHVYNVSARSSLNSGFTGEVFKLGETSWRRISNIPPRLFLTGDRPLYSQGALHWIGCHGEMGKRAVVSFNIGREEFHFTPIPTFLPSNNLTLLKGKFALFFELIDINFFSASFLIKDSGDCFGPSG